MVERQISIALILLAFESAYLECFVCNDGIEDEDHLQHGRQRSCQKTRPGAATLAQQEQVRAKEDDTKENERYNHPEEELESESDR